MALTKVSGGILDPGINVAGIVTATGFDGPFTGGTSRNITAGIVTATGLDINGNGDISGNLVVGGNLTANGDFTTLNTTLREVEILHVDANTTAVAGIITQRGSGDILNLFDTNTEVFTVKDGGKVGIGSEIPTNSLDINAAAGVGIRLRNATTNNSVYFTSEASDKIQFNVSGGSGSFSFFTGGSEKLTLTNAGNLGISTTVPAEKLSVAVPGNQRQNIAKFEHYGQQNFFIQGQWGSTDIGGANGTLLYGSGTVALRAATSGNAHLVNLASGNIGIGSVIPEQRLTVAGATDITHYPNTTVNNNRLQLGFNAPEGYLKVKNSTGSPAANLALYTTDTSGNTNKTMHLRYDSKVGIGTDNPIAKLTVDSGTTNTCATFQSSDTGAVINIKDSAARSSIEQNDTTLKIIADTDNSDDNSEIRFQVDASTKMRINSDGEVQIGTTTDPTADIKLLVAGNGGVSSGSYFSFRGDYGNVPEPAAYAIKFDSSLTNLSGAGGLHQYAYGGIAFNLGGQDRVNFTTTGKVLVGSGSTDASLLNVKGSAGFADDGTNAGIIIATDDANGAGIHCVTTGGFANGGYGIMRFNASQHKFTYGNNQRLLINASGKAIFSEEIETPQDYPNFRPTLNFNFVANSRMDPRISYSRTGPASFVNEFGKVVLVGSDAPRIDHHPDTKESLGLLIEPKKTNLWLYSEDLVTYVASNEMQQSTLANTTATTDPTGGTNAVKMAATATSGAHSFYKMFTSGSNGDVHTASVWVKAAGVDYARLYVDTVGGNMGGPGVTFSTGNTWNVSASGSATQTATSVVKYPNGWWRLSVSGSFSSQNAYYVHIDLEGGEGDVSFTGNGSDGMYVWGVQFESSTQTNVTSYIPTYGTAVTRGDDIVKLDGEDFTDFYNQEEGTLVSEFKIFDRIQSSAAIANINALSSSSYADSIMFMEVGHTSGYFGRVYKNSNGISLNGSSDQSSIVQNGNQTNKVSFGWSATSVNQGLAAYLNGTLQEESTDESKTPTNMTELRIGTGWQQNSAENQTWAIHAHIKKLMYYPKRLSNNQLAILTS